MLLRGLSCSPPPSLWVFLLCGGFVPSWTHLLSVSITRCLFLTVNWSPVRWGCLIPLCVCWCLEQCLAQGTNSGAAAAASEERCVPASVLRTSQGFGRDAFNVHSSFKRKYIVVPIPIWKMRDTFLNNLVILLCVSFVTVFSSFLWPLGWKSKMIQRQKVEKEEKKSGK